ncbi:MAG TPA: lipid-binding SYLF domain-containing protein [Burkholderiales bacterium]|nr:lipid-binding SYLF domain-containing protein [Burkholderiales bacterium]
MKQLLKLVFVLLAGLAIARVAAAQALDKDASAALNALYKSTPAAKALGAKAKAILVFPDIKKAAVLIGGQTGQGAMFVDGKVVGHYRADGVLAGLELGAQSFAYVMFFMSDKALQNLHASKGFELGTDPNIVIVDAGAAKNISTTTAQADVYSYIFGQKGIMGGISVEGLKITRLDH